MITACNPEQYITLFYIGTQFANGKVQPLKLKKMRRIVFALLLAIIFWGCNQQEKRENVILKEQFLQMEQEAVQKDSTINVFIGILNDIESNIRLIKQKEQIIVKNAALGEEMETDARQRIQDDMAIINELMERNKQSIAYLTKQLKQANFNISEFEQRIETANQQLDDRNREIEELKERLTQLNFSMETLNAQLDTLNVEKHALETELTKHKETLDMAWFSLGTNKELLENNVIEKSGGFLGMGKGYRLKADFNREYFVPISISQTTNIPLMAKQALLVTSHPSQSYQFVENEFGIIVSLEITDSDLFWEAGKYLVIRLKQ